MKRVLKCPRNASEIGKAQKRLNCGNDKYGNNQYLCLLHAEKTGHFEFCHDGIMGWRQNGTCLRVSSGQNLTIESCTDVFGGCPKKHYKITEFYKYPVCQNMHSSFPMRNENNDWIKFVPYIFGGILIFICFAFVAFVLWRKWQNLEKNKIESNEPKQNLLDAFTNESGFKGSQIAVTVQEEYINKVSVQTQPAENPAEKNKNESNQQKKNLLPNRLATTVFTNESSNKGGEKEVTEQVQSIEGLSVQTLQAENPTDRSNNMQKIDDKKEISTDDLCEACKNGKLNLVNSLLHQGATVNSCDRNGCSPLSAACENGYVDIVNCLLENGANVDFCNAYRVCPLSEACRKGQESTVLLLLKKGAKVNKCDIYGYSPIMYARESGNEHLVELLLSHGANVNLRDDFEKNDVHSTDINGVGPLFKAPKNEHESIVQLLLKYKDTYPASDRNLEI